MVLAALLIALVAGVAVGTDPSPVALSPSSQWYGVDGNWSALTIDLGNPRQTVNVLASTSLSELWVVRSGGCLDREPLCETARGNVFTVAGSNTWKSLGAWGLGLEYLTYGGSGDYGLDSVSANTIDHGTFSMEGVLTAAINSTDYYNGFLGLGIVQGRFGDQVHDSPLTQAVKQFGRIPSYSYGFTAGAYYGMTTGSSGIPCSLTLGGYDENRFVPHDVEFSLADNGNTPRVLVRGLSVSTAQDGRAPVGWNSTTRILSNMSTHFEALIDSSTPFLWLPDAVCDEFAQALGLVYDKVLHLYTISNTQFDELLGATFSFTFSLSSFDNTDDFGDPLSVPGVVNITITSAAFAQILRYPFQDGAIGYGDPSVPYFPLRRTGNLNSIFIIGRSFLQEAYIITKYDSGVFSLHQAQSPENPLTDLAIKRIDRPDNSPFPPPSGHRGGNGLATGQIVGIALGAGATAIIAGFVTWLCCRRRKASKAPADQEKTGSLSSLRVEGSQTTIARLFSRIIRQRRPRNTQIHEAPASASQPIEVGADAGHAVYEMPAPIGPMELDASHDDDSFNDDTLRTDDSHTITAYEAAKRKLTKQLQGPVPPYSPPNDPAHEPYPEKTMRDTNPAASHHTSGSHPSAVSSPTTTCGNSNSFPGSLPSPLSQRGDYAMNIPDLPSLITTHDSSPTATNQSAEKEQESSHGSHSLQALTNASNPSNKSSLVQSDLTPLPVTMSAGIQRTPIDASRVVYLGPLPEHSSAFSRGLDSGESEVPGREDPGRVSWGTLGSNYTELESQHLEGNTQRSHPSEQPSSAEGESPTEMRQEEASHPGSGASQRQGRVGSGSEFIHVPQLADRRYSWEDDR